MRPGVDSLVRVGVPRALALVGHFALFFALIALLLWLIVPVAFDQTQQALADVPRGDAATDQELLHSVREQALSSLESKLSEISEPDTALSTLVGTLAALAGVAFTLAAAAYWVVERDRLVNVVLAVVPHEKRTTVRDTWLLIDLKLGAVIRTKLLLVLMTASILSFAFWVIGLPYFLLVGVFAGIVEILPVIGPLIAGLTAVAAGLTVSWQLGLAAAIVVYGLRIVQDYVINPRLFGRAVHLPPLAVLLAVSAVALLLGPWWVPLAIPLTAVVSTLLDVLVWKSDPAEVDVPTVLAPHRRHGRRPPPATMAGLRGCLEGHRACLARPRDLTAQEMARRVLVSSLVLLLLVILALALWKIRLVVLLFLLAVVIASAMRPAWRRSGSAGSHAVLGIAVHYGALAAVVGVLLFFAVPRALSEVQGAISSLPETRSEIHEEASQSTGLKHDVLTGLERRLAELPSREKLVEPGVEVTRGAMEVLVGIFFVFAAAAYWISSEIASSRCSFACFQSARERPRRKTWELIDLKLGAFVRGQLLLMLLVGTVLSLAFWAIGMPYWLLVGAFAGVVEIVPVIGPLAAGALAVGVGLTSSVTTAVWAGAAVLIVRLVEDYLVMPRVLGDAVGLSPLLVLVAVAASGVVFGGLAVLFAIPVAAVLVTLLDVLVLKKDPAEEDAPSLSSRQETLRRHRCQGESSSSAPRARAVQVRGPHRRAWVLVSAGRRHCRE